MSSLVLILLALFTFACNGFLKNSFHYRQKVLELKAKKNSGPTTGKKRGPKKVKPKYRSEPSNSWAQHNARRPEVEPPASPATANYATQTVSII